MEKSKKINLIATVLALVIGIESNFLHPFSAVMLASTSYFLLFVLCKLMRLIKKFKSFLLESLVTFFGVWIITWTVVFNIL